jgi:hypothetical protein
MNSYSLVNFADGKVIREFQVAGLSAPSGMTVDGNQWIPRMAHHPLSTHRDSVSEIRISED